MEKERRTMTTPIERKLVDDIHKLQEIDKDLVRLLKRFIDPLGNDVPSDNEVKQEHSQ